MVIRIFQQLISNRHLASFSVMKYRHSSAFSPGLEPFGAEFAFPELREVESGREEHEFLYFRARRGVERSQVPAQTGAQKKYRFAAGVLFDDPELAGDGEIFEIALGQIGDLDLKSKFLEFAGEKRGFARRGTGGKPMEIEDTQLI